MTVEPRRCALTIVFSSREYQAVNLQIAEISECSEFDRQDFFGDASRSIPNVNSSLRIATGKETATRRVRQ